MNEKRVERKEERVLTLWPNAATKEDSFLFPRFSFLPPHRGGQP